MYVDVLIRYITETAAKSMYKQMILPLFDYNGFLLVSCTLEQKRELQKRQSNAIRTSRLYDRRDHITIERLHNEMNLLSLERRRSMQLLILLFIRSKKAIYIYIKKFESFYDECEDQILVYIKMYWQVSE